MVEMPGLRRASVFPIFCAESRRTWGVKVTSQESPSISGSGHWPSVLRGILLESILDTSQMAQQNQDHFHDTHSHGFSVPHVPFSVLSSCFPGLLLK